jgi:hypothetical protein
MTTEIKYHKPTDLLAELDSHGIYDAQMLDECGFDTSAVPVESHANVAAQIVARGLGGELAPDNGQGLISGYKVAYALAMQFLGDSPGTAYMGRGSSYRADYQALKDAGH